MTEALETEPSPGCQHCIGGMALSTSDLIGPCFRVTHIHDWTMANSPDGTGDWFGWANAVVSDLVPLGVGLEVRRRRRHNLKIGAYPITIILAAAALSVAGQLAEAKPSITGWLLAAVPALGFLALTKLVLSRPNPPDTSTVDTPARVDPPPVVIAAPDHELMPGARIIADAYLKATGQPISLDTLAERLRVPVTTAERLYAALHTTETRTSAAASPNGTHAVDALT